jgi:hypothetical protein
MRRPPGTRAALTLVAICASLAISSGGAEAPLDRYRSLLEEKFALQRENGSLEKEAELARSPAPYIFFDVQSGTLSFRVRGRAFKQYHVKAVSARSWGRRPIAPEALWRQHDALTILEKEGGRQEIAPPDDDGPEAPGGTGDPAAEEPDDATKLGVKAPEDYYIQFEEAVVFHVQSDRRRSLREKAVERVGEIAAGFRSRVRDLWGSDDGAEPLTLYLMTDAETARHIYHSILPGERLYISPPPPSVTVLTRQR